MRDTCVAMLVNVTIQRIVFVSEVNYETRF